MGEAGVCHSLDHPCPGESPLLSSVQDSPTPPFPGNLSTPSSPGSSPQTRVSPLIIMWSGIFVRFSPNVWGQNAHMVSLNAPQQVDANLFSPRPAVNWSGRALPRAAPPGADVPGRLVHGSAVSCSSGVSASLPHWFHLTAAANGCAVLFGFPVSPLCL